MSAADAEPESVAPRIFRSHDVVTFDDRRQAILDASIRLFEGRGYERTSIRDIAEYLRISKATIYYYFPTKGAILTAVYERALDQALTVLREVRGATKDPGERMSALVRAQVNLVVTDQSLMKVFFREFESLEPDLRQEIRRKSRAYDEQVRQTLEEGIADGVFRSDLDPALAARIIVGMVNWIHRWYQPGGAVTPEGIADALAALLEHGYLA